MKTASRALVIAAFLGVASSASAADIENGLKLSKQWCAACHVVSSDQKSASVDVPTFGDIAHRKTEKKPLAADELTTVLCTTMGFFAMSSSMPVS